MAYEIKDLTGSLFRNDRKTTDKHPDKTGSCKIDGKDYWISCWVKISDDGQERFSLAFKLKEEKADKPYRQPAPQQPTGAVARKLDIDDDIPF
jgi:hypothetical protein